MVEEDRAGTFSLDRSISTIPSSAMDSISIEPLLPRSFLQPLQSSASPAPEVDVVFVHGLSVGGLVPWTQSKCLSLPEDLCPEELKITKSRILAFGYNSNVFGFGKDFETTPEIIGQHAQRLLDLLEQERRTPEVRKRPIIFMGHSLGGIVVQTALRISEQSKPGRPESSRFISDATYGVFSFGQLGMRQSELAKFRQLEYSSRTLKATDTQKIKDFGRIAQNEAGVESRMKETWTLSSPPGEESSKSYCYLRERYQGPPSQSRTRRLYNICLPTCQLLCTSLMGNYRRSCKGYGYENVTTCSASMLWQCGQIEFYWPSVRYYLVSATIVRYPGKALTL
jgi:hypothetical protein